MAIPANSPEFREAESEIIAFVPSSGNNLDYTSFMALVSEQHDTLSRGVSSQHSCSVQSQRQRETLPESICSSYALLHSMGEGTFAKVKLAQHGMSKEYVAIKVPTLTRYMLT